MYEYVCYTKQGHWRFYADSDIDSMRFALYLCCRDNEDFIKVESATLGKPYTLRLCKIDKTNSIQTL